MRHIVAHLIRGEAGKAHENITKESITMGQAPWYDRSMAVS